MVRKHETKTKLEIVDSVHVVLNLRLTEIDLNIEVPIQMDHKKRELFMGNS